MEIIKAYECSLCGRIHKAKAACKKHENKCFHNPVTKSCASCQHHEWDVDTVHRCDKGQDISGRHLKTQCVGYTPDVRDLEE